MNLPRLSLAVLGGLLFTVGLSAQAPVVPVTPAGPATLPVPELTEQWWPVPPVVRAPADAPPSDAIVLFDGKSLDAWEGAEKPGPAGWTVADGAMTMKRDTGDIRTKAGFGDVQLHLEFRSPAEVKGRGQGRGNSGIFFMERYELQVLDSYENKTYVNGQLGSIYKQHPPLVNPARPPGVWQTYDVIFTAPRFKEDGSLQSPARITALLNGVLVLNNVELLGPTEYRGPPSYKAHPAKLPLKLQDHGDLVSYRNIWVREL